MYAYNGDRKNRRRKKMNKQNKNIKRTGYFTINLKDENIDSDDVYLNKKMTLTFRKKMFTNAVNKLEQQQKRGLIYINSIDYQAGEIMYEIL